MPISISQLFADADRREHDRLSRRLVSLRDALCSDNDRTLFWRLDIRSATPKDAKAEAVRQVEGIASRFPDLRLAADRVLSQYAYAQRLAAAKREHAEHVARIRAAQAAAHSAATARKESDDDEA